MNLAYSIQLIDFISKGKRRPGFKLRDFTKIIFNPKYVFVKIMQKLCNFP